MKQSPAFPL